MLKTWYYYYERDVNAMKKNFLNFFLLLFPFIDFFTSIATWNSWPSIGIIVKGIFLLYATLNILRNCHNKKIWIMFGILFLYGFFSIGFRYFNNPSLVSVEITNLFKIYYLPILILYFGMKKDVSRKIVVLWFLEFLLLYLIPYPFNLGHNISEVYPNKNLYLSYFYVGNELANIFILLMPMSFFFLIDCKRKYLFVFILLTSLMLLLLGTKTTYCSVIIILLYFLFCYRKKFVNLLKRNKIVVCGGCVFLVLGLFLWIPNSSLYQNVQEQFQFYEIDEVKDIFNFQNIDHIIFSNRLTFLGNVNKVFKDSPWTFKLMGLGRGTIQTLKDIEMDVFDIFYSVGLVGFIIYLFFFVNVLKNIEMNRVTSFTFILLCIISCFTGHVLISPMTTTYLAALFGVERNRYEKLD